MMRLPQVLSTAVSSLERDAALWATIADIRRLTIFRPPYGEFDEAKVATAAAAGFNHIVLWDVDPRDWTLPAAAEIVRRTLRDTRSGSIVALHVVDRTADALGPMIEGLRRRALTPVTIPSLFEAATTGSTGR